MTPLCDSGVSKWGLSKLSSVFVANWLHPTAKIHPAAQSPSILPPGQVRNGHRLGWSCQLTHSHSLNPTAR